MLSSISGVSSAPTNEVAHKGIIELNGAHRTGYVLFRFGMTSPSPFPSEIKLLPSVLDLHSEGVLGFMFLRDGKQEQSSTNQM